MKKLYDRKAREWVEPHELEARTLKRKKECKGKQPHKYVKVLPPYVTPRIGVIADAQWIDEYYSMQKRHREECIQQDKELEELGIQISYGSKHIEIPVHYRCAQCFKKEINVE